MSPTVNKIAATNHDLQQAPDESIDAVKQETLNVYLIKLFCFIYCSSLFFC